jgi:tetratricopeptide (TPR) repeat protein
LLGAERLGAMCFPFGAGAPERTPKFPILHSFSGYQHCNMLLDLGEYKEVRLRANQFLEWDTAPKPLLDIALGHLSPGRAVLIEAGQGNKGDLSQPAGLLDQAVKGLRRAGTQHNLPFGLLARAGLRRIVGNFDAARADLDEASAIAEHGSMGLHQADAHLEDARLHLAFGESDKARESLAIATQMIGEMGYHRRDGEVQDLEAQLG